MRFFLLYLSFALLPVTADWINVIALSPQKTWQIQRRQVGSSSGGDPEFIDFVDLKSGKIAFSFVSIRRNTDVEWSSDGTSVAINDRIATSGDFLYIFRVTNGQITLVRAPGDDALKGLLMETYNLKSTGRFTLTGRHWLSNSALAIRVTGGGYGNDIAFEAVVNIDDAGRLLFDQKSVKQIH